MKNLFLFFFLFLPCICFSQNYFIIKGRVLDPRDSSGVSFANIYMQASNMGTASNDAGQFELHFPANLLQDTLIISSIGYASLRIAIKDHVDSDNVFFIQPRPYLLKEVEVFSQKDSIQTIVEKAFKSIKKNYSHKQYYTTAFYRSVKISGGTYSRLIEAAIDIQDYGMNSTHDKTRIKVNELRKSDDYTQPSLMYKILTKDIKLMFGEKNELYLLFDRVNFPKHYQQDYGLFNKSFIKEFVFELEEITHLDSAEVYVISYFHENYLKRPDLITKSRLYIKMDDYAIIKIEHNNYITIISEKTDEKEITPNGTTIAFRKIGETGKYYLHYVDKFDPFNPAEDNFVHNDKYNRSTLLINDVILKKRDYEKIKNRMQEEKDIDLYKKDFAYNPEFWKNYNVILLAPLDSIVESDLNDRKSLEDQFNSNGKN